MAGGFLNIRRQAHDMSKSTASAKAAKKDKTAAPQSDEEKWDFTKPLREAVSRFRHPDRRVNWLVLAIFVVAVAALFGYLLAAPLSAMEKFFGSALLMLVAGELVRGWMGWNGFLGLIMFKDRSTLGWIDRQAQRYTVQWKALANVGMVMGYGFCSYFLLGKNERKARTLALILAVGIPLLLLFSTVVAPSAYDVLRDAIGGSELSSASAQMRASAPLHGNYETYVNGQKLSIPWMSIAAGLLLVLGGMAAMVWASILLYALTLVPPLLNKFISIALGLAGNAPLLPAPVPAPGGMPLLPGITPGLPLVEGLIALAVLLVVHEMSHGFLARVHRIRLDAAGVAFFGIMPFGGFVEPDEKELDKMPIEQSNQVLVAGSTANMLTATIMFVVWVVLAAIVVLYFNWGAPAANAAGGMMDFLFHAGLQVLGFVFRTVGLVLALNILVGIVNLLPVPLFDGHRLMVAGVKNKLAAEAITWLTLGAFVINFLPWIFR